MHEILKSKKAILVAGIVAILGWAGFTVAEQDVTQVVDLVLSEEVQTQPSAKENFNAVSLITPDRRVHILYGDATGGGHKFGTGRPCKSEFPQHWDDKTIIKEVELIAANDNLDWEQQRNGYHVAEQKVGTVEVRVVKDRDNAQVITAYPVNMPRNPCPTNDN